MVVKVEPPSREILASPVMYETINCPPVPTSISFTARDKPIGSAQVFPPSEDN